MSERTDDLLDEIKKIAAISGDGDELSFSDRRYRTIPFSKRHFRELTLSDSGRSIAFVDGGIAELIRTPNLSVHFVRAAFAIYQKGKKITHRRVDAHILAKYVPGKDAYSVRFFPALFEEMLFSSEDPTLKEGVHKAPISKMGEVARRFLEIMLAKEAVELLASGDLLIRDGTLQASVTGESRFLSDLYGWASGKGVIVGALAKTTTLLTRKGNNAITAISSIAPSGRWLYYPSCEIAHPDHLANLYFAKLHEDSRYAFRIELYNKSRYSEEEIFSLLSFYSSDAQLPGYPYGLIAVDRLAKVDSRESEVHRMRLLARLGDSIESGLGAMDAHKWF